MVPSIYVIQKSSGQLYCVTVKHYEQYKHWYDVADIRVPEENLPEPESDLPNHTDIEMVVEDNQVKVKKTRGK